MRRLRARKRLDVSEHGENTEGLTPGIDRGRGQVDGISIKGLPIGGADPDRAGHHSDLAIRGPVASLALPRDGTEYPPVIVGSLLREIDDQIVVGAMQ